MKCNEYYEIQLETIKILTKKTHIKKNNLKKF